MRLVPARACALLVMALAMATSSALTPAASAQTGAPIVNPIVIGLTPNFGSPRGDTAVTITATNVDQPTAVLFGSARAAITGVRRVGPITRIDVRAPAGTGVVDVTVSSPAGTSAVTEQDEFSYAPEITSIQPNAGPAGTQVVISGRGITTALVKGVNFGNVPATSFKLVAGGPDSPCGPDVRIPCVVATVPAGSGVVDVTLTGAGGTSDIVAQDQYSYAPELTAIAPRFGRAGITVIILGTGLRQVTGVSFGSTPATPFKVIVQQPGLREADSCGRNVPVGTVCVLATAPAGSGVVDVTLTGPGGTSQTSEADEFSYAPGITSIAPNTGPAGTQVAIFGTNLTPRLVSGVDFGGVPATAFSVRPGGPPCRPAVPCVVATAPPGSGVVDVTLTGAAGTSDIVPQDEYSYAPEITSITPNAGPSGTRVLILGRGLIGRNGPLVTGVNFGPTPATRFTVSDGALRSPPCGRSVPAGTPCVIAEAPAGNGIVDVTLTGPGGTSPTGPQDQYSYGPRITSLTPSFGTAAGGTAVKIEGVGFMRPGGGADVSAVMFGSTPGQSVRVNSDNTLVTVSPPGTGIVDVTVIGSGGTSGIVAGDQFSYVSGTPLIASVAPNAGPSTGGTSVVIQGKAFTGALSVSFGTTNAVFTVNSDTQITATAPSGFGTVNLRIATPGGIAVSANAYTYIAQPPQVSAVSPNQGPLGGGTQVTITGAAFSRATGVTFGSTAASAFNVASDTQITATSPAGTGSVDVTITTPGGTSVTSVADVFTYLPAPSVTSVAPDSGPVTGGTAVSISGSNFTSVSGVSFGKTPAASFTVTSPTQISAVSPSGSGSVDISVTTPGGTSAIISADLFAYLPVLTSISPASGPASGGTQVTIIGAGFNTANAVLFGGVPASGLFAMSDTQIQAKSPPGTGSVDVVVLAPTGGSSIVSADQFTYIPAPVISSVSPNQGPVTGGTPVLIGGSGFTGASSVNFGSTPATSFTIASGVQISAISPPGAGGVDITVTTPGGTSATSANDVFAYVPVVSAITPNQGPGSGATQVTITGAGFVAATAVYFGGVPATGFSALSDTQIQANSPPGSGTVDIVVANAAGSSAIVPADQFTYRPSPVVTLVSPTQGPAGGGTPVIISGSGFTGATSVNFGATPATTFSIGSDAQINATSPAGVGQVHITVTTPGGASATSTTDLFTYLGTGPVVGAVDPNSGPTSGGTALTITGVRFTGATSVQFGAIPAAGFSVISDTQVNVISPSVNSPGVVDITVTTPNGSSAPGATDQFNYENGGRGYVTNAADASVSVFDTSSNTVLRTIPVPPAADQPATTPGLDALVISPDGEQLYVAARNNNTVYALDVVSGAVRATFNTLANGGACGPMGLAVTPDGTRLYVEGSTCATVTVLDTSTRGQIGLIANVPNVAEGGKVAVSAAAGQAFFADTGTVVPGGALQVLNTTTNTLVSQYLGAPFFGVAVDNAGTNLWFAGGSDVEYRLLGCCSSMARALGTSLRGVAAVRNGVDIVAIADAANTLWIVTFDGESFNFVPVAVGNNPLATAVSLDASMAYVTNQNDNTVSVVDTSTDAVVTSISVGASPTDIGVTPNVPPGA